MDAVESAIRNALARGDARDRRHRENVYRQVFAALEKSISSNAQLAPDIAQRRREHLKLKITQIEQEFIPALPPEPAPQVRAPASPAQAAAAAAPRQTAGDAPSIDLGDRRGAERAPSLDAGSRGRFDTHRLADENGYDTAQAGPAVEVEPERRVRRRRIWPRLLIAATVLAALLIGAYWVVTTGLMGRQDTSVPNPPAPAEDYTPPASGAPPTGAAQAQPDRDWLPVFRPNDPSSVAATSGARAEVMHADGEAFMRVRSTQPGAAVAFDIKQGVLERMAGRKTVFDISARAEEGKETQISITCNFGSLGDCGRRRYIVGHNKGDYLFEIELPAGRPRGAGSIIIVSDVENTGKAIDVFEIRISAGQ